MMNHEQPHDSYKPDNTVNKDNVSKEDQSSDRMNNFTNRVDNQDETGNIKSKVDVFSDNLKSESVEKENIVLSRKTRCYFSLIVVGINLLINLQNGTIPAATHILQQDLNIDEEQLGLFGSFVFLGSLIGSIIVMYTIPRLKNRKWFFIATLTMNGICMFTFTMVNKVGFLYFNRIIFGIFESFVVIYCPVWVDQYVPRNRKTLMMSVLQATSSLGVVLGFILTSLLVQKDISWKVSFIVQSILYAIAIVGLLFCPAIYFSNTLHCVNPINNANRNKSKSNTKRNDVREIEIKDEPKVINDEIISLFQHESKDDSNNFLQNLKSMVKIKVFMLCVVAISTLLFISTIIQFWTSDYLIKVLKVPESSILLAYAITCITAPVLGIIVGGGIVQKFGGYESKNSLYFVFGYALLAVCFAIPITQFDSLVGFAIFLWLFLFFGGCIVPNLAGVILASLPNNLKGPGQSVTAFFTHLIGFLPAPYFYGMLYKYTHKTSPKFAYGFCVIWSVSALIWVFCAMLIRRSQFKKLEEQQNNLSDISQIEFEMKKEVHFKPELYIEDVPQVKPQEINIEIINDEENKIKKEESSINNFKSSQSE